jgi:hypothetical protein
MSLSHKTEVYKRPVQADIRVTIVTILILSVLSIGSLQPTVARAQPQPQLGVNITTPPPKCLDADLPTINQNGTKVQLWDCWGGDNQKWNVYPIEGTIYFTITNVQSGRCLDADLPTINQNGTKVQLWDCWGGDNQKWRWNDFFYPSTDLHPGDIGDGHNIPARCLDADLNTLLQFNNNGTLIKLWDCRDSQNQLWINPVGYIGQ